MTYRRNLIPGGTFFFTVNLRDRKSDHLVKNIDALRNAIRAARTTRPFHIDAWVLLPDHMHCIWTLPENDHDFPARWQAIKIAFSKSLPQSADCDRDKLRPRERGIWQRRYWEHTVRDEQDYTAHMDYIHFNPVKHGLANEASEWPYSTFRRCVALGLYPPNWAGSPNALAEAGEPL